MLERPVDLQDAAEYQLVNAKRSRGGIVARERLPGSAIRVKDQHRVEAGDFLMSRRQIIHGACGVVPAELAGAVVSNEYSILRPKAGLSTDYLRQLSHTRYFQRTCFHSSVGVDVEKMVFKIERWMAFSTSVPPLEEQDRICAVLGSVDDAIANDEAVVQATLKLRTALLATLMAQGLAPRPRVDSSSIPSAPATWRVVTVGDVATDLTYGTSKKLNASTGTETFPVLRIPNVVGQSVDSDLKYLALPAKEVDALRLVEGDLLLVRTNGNPNYVGRSLLFPRREGTWLFASYLIRVRVDVTRVLPAFLHYALQAPAARRSIERAIRTSAGNYNLNTQGICATEFCLPPLAEQHVVVAALGAVDLCIDRERSMVAERRRLKAALADALLTGKIRVPAHDAA